MGAYSVVWKGPVRRGSGLGIASRNYVRALRRQGVRVSVDHDGMRAGAGLRVLVWHYPPDRIRLSQEKRRYDRVILNAVWETTRIPRSWMRDINRFDAIMVPSRQNKEAFRASGVTSPIFIVPHGVNTSFFRPGNRPLKVKGTAGKFVFVSVFGFQHRKNPETLLKAYWKAFSAGDKVHLVLKTNGYAPYENKPWIEARIRRLRQKLGLRKSTPPVTVLAHRMDEYSLRGIYTLGDVFVLPTRGEGVGLPFLESMASGTPVIATGWGGHMDFLTERNAFKVGYRLRHPAEGMNRPSAIARPFRALFNGRGQRWAEADEASLIRQMRKAYLNPGLCRQKGRQARLDAARLTWDRAGTAMKNAIGTVAARQRR
ncbi:glycosyltransferase family 4 protein [Cohnella sp. JJ-181]|uniref:glycosyltransferase family 4 protein n=1 Tax=Cohnella rhizoplanae TaxID=2974897 RepID=UPI0022FFBD35|nr:glycosyltransferase family 4 protein [Cohnella sp. JJ-181]CAI6081686.1 D-inositol-3-phosphate glycosyltransferase [Cohnella sp. JJ-181]